MRRVVVTGMGAVTPIGTNAKDFWASITQARCGIDRITKFDPSTYQCQIAAEVKDLDASHVLDKKEQRKHDDFVNRMTEKGYTQKQVRLLCEWYLRVRKAS